MSSLRDDGWVRPNWLEHQLDPASPAHVADQAGPGAVALVNVTARNWTAIGNLDSPLGATVDQRGLVTPSSLFFVDSRPVDGGESTTNGGGWSLDWWIGADDRWHLPSREAAVRQRLLDGMPVVETSMRVPGGDAVHRAYAVRMGDDELVVVEVENRSPAPVALALSVRPYDAAAVGGIRRVEQLDDTTIAIDGRVGLLLARRPNRLAGSVAAAGDVAAAVLAGGGSDELGPLDDPEGLATAAFVWPLPHRTVLRVALPLRSRPPSRPRKRVGPAPSVAALPGAQQVANGWKAHGARGLRLVLPDDRLTDCVDANRRHLLANHERLGPDPTVLGALDRFGFAAEVRSQLLRYPEQLRREGGFGGPDGDGAALHAMAEHWRFHRDRALVTELAPTVASLAESIGRAARPRRARDRRPAPTASRWPSVGLLAAAELLAAAGENTAADDAVRLAGSLPPSDPQKAETQDDGPDVRATVEHALAEVEAGDPATSRRLQWLLDAATPTWTWPTVVHPRLRGGAAGDGHDIVVAAGVLTVVRQLLVREVPAGLALVSVLPEAWLGRGLEVHDAPSGHGLVSFAVRWHGDRPALLWDRADNGGGEVTLTAPGLDPSWSSTARSGEALLSPVPVPVPATRVGLSPRRR